MLTWAHFCTVAILVKMDFENCVQQFFKSMMCDCTFLYFFAKICTLFMENWKIAIVLKCLRLFFIFSGLLQSCYQELWYGVYWQKSFNNIKVKKRAGVGALEFWTKCTQVSAVCTAENWNVWLYMPVCGWKSVSTYSLFFLLPNPAFYLVPHFVCFLLFSIFSI